MIFYRSLRHPDGTSHTISSVRAMVVVALAAYPAGACLRAFGSDSVATAVTGLGLILVSFIAFARLAGTRLSRLTGEERDRLDEYERNLRAEAMERGYQILGGLTLLAIIYLAMSSDAGWWIPSGYEQWSAVFWGVFLWSSLLPTAILAFRLRADEDEVAR